MITLANATDGTDFEAPAFENPTQLEVWFCTVHRVNAPVDAGELFASGVSACQRSQCRQSTFTSSVDMRQLYDKRTPFNPEPPKQIGRARPEDEWLVAQDDGSEFLVRHREDFVWRIAFNEEHWNGHVLRLVLPAAPSSGMVFGWRAVVASTRPELELTLVALWTGDAAGRDEASESAHGAVNSHL